MRVHALWIGLLFLAAPLRAEDGFSIVERAMVDEVEQAYVRYPSGSLSVSGWLFVYPYSEEDTEPCLIFNHGGTNGVGEATKAKCRWLAKQGYIVFAPSYRGEDDSEGEIEVAKGEVDDVVAAMLLLREHPGIRTDEFVLVGTSHGALISILASTNTAIRPMLKGIVAAYGVMDIYAWYQHLLDNGFDVHDPISQRVYGNGPKDKPEAFAERHALARIPKLADAPIFLVQGELDKIVPKQQALTMYAELRKANRHQDNCRVYPDAGHGFLFWDDPAKHPVEELRSTENAWHDILQFLGGLVGPEEEWDGER